MKEEKEDGENNKSKNMDTLCLGFLYFKNNLRNIKKEALKMVFVVRSIRVFSKFSLDPYYEPLATMFHDIYSIIRNNR